MQGCRVGPQTVTNVVRQFEKKGLIEVKTKQGLFKSAAVVPDWLGLKEVHLLIFAAGGGKIEEVHHQFNHGLYNNELLFQLNDVLSQQGLSLKVHRIPLDATGWDVEQWIVSHRCSGCLTLGLNQEGIVSFFQKNFVPLVNLFPATASILPNSLIIDPAEVVGKQVGHLLELGHRRIGYLHRVEAEKFHRDQFFRREAFYRMVAEGGLPLKPHWVQYGGYSAELVTAAMERMLAGSERPTAVIVADHQLGAVYHALSEHGLRVGKGFSVVGTDDLPIAAMVHPAATTLRVPRLGAIEMAMAMLKKLIKNEEIESIQKLPVRLVKRDSTAPTKPASFENAELCARGSREEKTCEEDMVKT